MHIILLIVLSIAHAFLYYYGYITNSVFLLILVVNVLMFLPIFIWNRYNKKIIYAICMFLLFTTNIIILKINNTSFGFNWTFIVLGFIAFIIPLFINKSKLCLLYIVLFGYILQSATNYDIIYIPHLNIHYYPTALFMLFYIPIIKIFKINELFPQKGIIFFIVSIIFLGVILQIYNPVGIAIIVSLLLNAIPEEIVFRAWLFYELDGYTTSNLLKILSSSVIFLSIHLPILLDKSSAIIEYIHIFSLGMLLAFIYYKTKNIYLPSIVHTASNALVVFINM